MADAMRDEGKRMETFTQGVRGKPWPHLGTQLHPARMAAAGLYFDPTDTAKDRVVCFACKGSLQSWEATDSPWVDHRTHYPKCPFVLSAAPVQLRNDPSIGGCHLAAPKDDTTESLLAESFKLLEMLFQSLDKDSAKVITLKQLNGLVSTRGFKYGAALDSLISTVDGDSNSVLNFKEFMHLIYISSQDPLLSDMGCFFRHPNNQSVAVKTFSRLAQSFSKLGLTDPRNFKLPSSQIVNFCESAIPLARKQPNFEQNLQNMYHSDGQTSVPLPELLSILYSALSTLPDSILSGKYDVNPICNTGKDSGSSNLAATTGNSSVWTLMQSAFVVLENDFVLFDLNGNGLVDFDEITSHIPQTLSAAEKLRIQSRLQHAFNMVDSDQSCQLDFMEFMSMGYQLTIDGPYTDLVHASTDSALVRSFFNSVRTHYKTFDTDRNGRLTAEEIKVFSVTTFGREMPEIEQNFNRIASPSSAAGGRMAVDIVRFIKLLYLVIRHDGPFVPEKYDPQRSKQIAMVTSIPIVVESSPKLSRFDSVVASNFTRMKILSKSSKGLIESLGSYDGISCTGRTIEGSLEQSVMQALKNEVDLISKLDHPNCVQFLGSKMTPEDGGILILSEFCETGSLFDFYSRKSANFDYLTGIRIAIECASGLLALHEFGYMHRNLKSPNVQLTRSLVAKISQFGNATKEATSSEVKGTIQWMAPEVLSNWFGIQCAYDRSCDIYSFGVLLWEIFHCNIPYADTAISQKEIAENVFKNNRRPILSRSCPESIAQIIVKSWDRQIRARPSLPKILEMLNAAKADVPDQIIAHATVSNESLSAMLQSISAPAPKVAKKSLHACPADVYVPWQKSHTNYKSLFDTFVQEAGSEAGDVLLSIQRRHQPISFDQKPMQASCAIWEEKWSSLEPSRDPEGEDLVANLASILRRRQLQFKDPFFPPDASSLYVDPRDVGKNINAATGGRTDQQAFLAGKDVVNKVVWKRPAEILNPRDKVKVWSGSIGPEDVAQGSLGNCYFMAALAACAAEENDILINDLLIEDYADVGLYGVKFFFMGRWITVVVDDFFPCEPWGSQYKPLFCSPKKNSQSESDTKEIWPMLFEKAFAKLHGSYECTDSGFSEDALQYLTAGVVELKKLKITDEDFEWLRSAFPENSSAHGACTPSSKTYTSAQLTQVGLVSGHAYSVLKAVRSRSGIKLVQVRNPWGRIEWKGRFSDKSADWTPALKAEVGFRDEEDGSFFMEFSDFVNYFMTCKKVDPRGFNKLSKDNFATIDGAAGYWLAGKTAGGSNKSPTFGFNPAFDLTGEGGEVIITVYQSDIRHTILWPSEDEKYEPFIEVGIYFGEAGQQLRSIGELYGGFDGDRLTTTTVKIQGGHRYRVVVAAASPGIEGAFSLTACGRGVELAAVPAQPVPPAAAANMAPRRKPGHP